MTSPPEETIAYACPARVILHTGETDFFDPSEYTASHENCADCPDVSDETPEIAMAESDGFTGVAAFA